MNDLDDLYREIILDHYKNPRNQGVLEGPTVHAEEGFNPLCGDEVKVYVQVEDGVVHDIKITGQGCSISRSSASLMSQAVKGQSLDEVKATVSRFKRMIAVEETEDLDVLSHWLRAVIRAQTAADAERIVVEGIAAR
ncbi:Fe-S cluster assembly sulfur transfer protein SufU [Ferrimicrobium sp.]|uniref:Fe-S cluster assembly sulfur transfer protein SufU n=1 Tax=Ferrimicrobium sp. TaxID=2926050 RepID=UPI002634E4E5|nr:SUF system NifU family Fe-S cluster assembly protein [Ferrimicrobium sp.]